MPPARRLKKYKNSKNKEKRKLFPVFLLVTSVVLVISILIGFFVAKPKKFNDDSKFSIAVNSLEKTYIFVFNPQETELTTIEIPSSVEVDVSRDLGKFKLGNVWKLGQNEKVGGKLLQETVVKNFGFPITSWADDSALNLIHGNIFQKLSAIFNRFDTNLTIGDKIKIATFSIGKARTKVIDLKQTSFLREANFLDGENGYEVTRSYPTSLILVFAESDISKKQLKVAIKNVSGMNSYSIIPWVIEFSGAKVVSELKEPQANIFCEVVSEQKDFAKKISDVFGCAVKIKKLDGNFDAEISIGSDFLQRY